MVHRVAKTETDAQGRFVFERSRFPAMHACIFS